MEETGPTAAVYSDSVLDLVVNCRYHIRKRKDTKELVQVVYVSEDVHVRGLFISRSSFCVCFEVIVLCMLEKMAKFDRLMQPPPPVPSYSREIFTYVKRHLFR